MTKILPTLAGLVLLLPPCRAENPPRFSDETLSYSVNWPSGLSLGEGRLVTRQIKGGSDAGDRWEFQFSLDAAIPGFQVADRHRSLASAGLCSIELEKEATHGKRKSNERTVFEPKRGIATRQTLDGGGKSEMEIPECPRDALAFLYHVRRELASGRVPPPQTIYFGAPYAVHFEFGGRQTVNVGGVQVEADRLVASIRGKASDVTVELFFALDGTHRPVLVRVPLALGTFSLELVR
jgi:Protein of unknown function (DUF3108)